MLIKYKINESEELIMFDYMITGVVGALAGVVVAVVFLLVKNLFHRK